ncbi:hypothetical protein Tco_0660459, partial [Tanacetum coccineum]
NSEVTPFVESKEWIETNNELYTIMEDFMKRMNQQREQEALLVAQREQELREQEQAAQEKEELSPNFHYTEKKSDEFIKSSVEDLIPIPKESEDTFGSDSESVLPSSDDFSPIVEEKSVTFSNPLFEFDDEYISNDVNLFFDEVLKNIESKDSYVSNLDEPALLVTPLSDANEDECFRPQKIEQLMKSTCFSSNMDIS